MCRKDSGWADWQIITNLPIDAPSGSGNLTRLDLDMIQLVSIDVYVISYLFPHLCRKVRLGQTGG